MSELHAECHQLCDSSRGLLTAMPNAHASSLSFIFRCTSYVHMVGMMFLLEIVIKLVSKLRHIQEQKLWQYAYQYGGHINAKICAKTGRHISAKIVGIHT